MFAWAEFLAGVWLSGVSCGVDSIGVLLHTLHSIPHKRLDSSSVSELIELLVLSDCLTPSVDAKCFLLFGHVAAVTRCCQIHVQSPVMLHG